METPFSSLLEEQRFEECRILAEQYLQTGVQTTDEDAQCHHVIACCHLGMENATTALPECQQALALARTAGNLELEGSILFDLAEITGRLRRYSDEIATLQEYLALAAEQSQPLPKVGEARYRLGKALYQAGEYDQAMSQLREAISLASTDEEGAAREAGRRALRMAAIAAGELAELPALLRASREYLKGHPEDQETLFWYWHDRADYAIALGKLRSAERAAWQAANAGIGQVGHEFAGQMLLCRKALASGEPGNAARFACEARIVALGARRYDLACEAADAMIALMREHGLSVLAGLDSHYAKRGMNLFRYLPEQLLRPR